MARAKRPQRLFAGTARSEVFPTIAVVDSKRAAGGKFAGHGRAWERVDLTPASQGVSAQFAFMASLKLASI